MNRWIIMGVILLILCVLVGFCFLPSERMFRRQNRILKQKYHFNLIIYTIVLFVILFFVILKWVI